MKLYEIANEYQSLLQNIANEETGEINENAISKLEEVQDNIKNKGIAVASYIRNLETEQEAIDNAIKRMEARKKQLEKQSEFLINYLKSNMERCSITEISCPYFIAKLKKCPISVNIINEDFIPNDYKKTKEIVSIDKLKIKEEILAGVIISGAEIKQNTRLEIR